MKVNDGYHNDLTPFTSEKKRLEALIMEEILLEQLSKTRDNDNISKVNNSYYDVDNGVDIQIID